MTTQLAIAAQYQDNHQVPPVEYIPNFLESHQAKWLFEYLGRMDWPAPRTMNLRSGGLARIPRLELLYGDSPSITYAYGGGVYYAKRWSEPLSRLRHLLEGATGYRFEMAFCNCYRDGSDKIGWHSDSDLNMGENPPIATLSLGVTRRLAVRQAVDHGNKTEFDLAEGSLLIMQPGMQQEWEHCLLPESRCNSPRYSLTFRPWKFDIRALQQAAKERRQVTSTDGREGIICTIADNLAVSIGGRVEPWSEDWSLSSDKIRTTR